MNKDVLSSCIIDHRGNREVKIYRDSALKLFDWSEEQEEILKDHYKGPGRKVVRVEVRDGEDASSLELQSRVMYALANIILPRYLDEIYDTYDGLFETMLMKENDFRRFERVYHNVVWKFERAVYEDPEADW
jgi:hypothetical protein